ncbi:hypothetical protein ACFLTD_01840 [Elusimicrobiota bacterium]
MIGFKRKKYLINKKLQLKLILTNIFLMIFIALILGGGIYMSIWKSVTEEFSEMSLTSDLQTITRMREYESVRQQKMIELLPAIREEAKMLSDQQKSVLNRIIIRSNINLIPVLVVICIIIYVIGLIYTNRLAGPIYRMNMNLNAVQKGKLSQNFILRQKDDLKELALSMETIVKMFSDTVKSSKESLEMIKNAATDDQRQQLISQMQQLYSKFEI